MHNRTFTLHFHPREIKRDTGDVPHKYNTGQAHRWLSLQVFLSHFLFLENSKSFFFQEPFLKKRLSWFTDSILPLETFDLTAVQIQNTGQRPASLPFPINCRSNIHIYTMQSYICRNTNFLVNQVQESVISHTSTSAHTQTGKPVYAQVHKGRHMPTHASICTLPHWWYKQLKGRDES